tara:strand:+ start:576 stop:995 length:420 start_codon:yes stop_codon:yes gene_type:complete
MELEKFKELEIKKESNPKSIDRYTIKLNDREHKDTIDYIKNKYNKEWKEQHKRLKGLTQYNDVSIYLPSIKESILVCQEEKNINRHFFKRMKSRNKKVLKAIKNKNLSELEENLEDMVYLTNAFSTLINREPKEGVPRC